MDEKTALTNEEKGKAVLRLLSTFFIAEGIAAVIFLIVPIVFLGFDRFAQGMPLTVIPFVIAGAIVFGYYNLNLKKIHGS